MSGPAVRVAYLVSEYPALSHVFVEREVRALRAAGAEVATFSVRPAAVVGGLSSSSRREAARTITLQGTPWPRVCRVLARAAWRRPRGVARAAATALRHGAPGPRGRVWQLCYLAEALLLVEAMDRIEVSHVHAHFANNAADIARLAAALGGRSGRTFTWTMSMHGPTEFADASGHDLAAKLRSAAGVACISEYCREQVRAVAGPLPTTRLPVVRMTVDPAEFVPPPPGPVGGPLKILFVGRLVPEKGPLDLLAAIAALVDQGRALAVRIAGTGPLDEDVRDRVARDGLGDVVDVLGPVGQERVVELHRWSDVLCLPSYAEGVPVVLMEAMATGRPVVTTPVAGIPELVRDRETGVLVEPGDVDGLAEALGGLADAPDLRRRLGERGRAHVAAEFSPRPNAERLLAFLRDTGGVR